MSFYDRVWREAAETFGVGRGHKKPLNPFSRTWQQVLARADHALWLWNDKYGPLNRRQREYAADLVCYALRLAGEQTTPGDHYAYFHTTLDSLLNHEKSDFGFKSRADSTNHVADLIAEVA